MLRYGPLGRASLHLRAYADASFASSGDMSSQLGFIVLLCDGADRCHVLTYASKKARRVVRSIMAGEVSAFSDAFDAAYILKHDLERVYDEPLPLVMPTDSKQMFDVITRASHTTKKRLMIDVAAARDAYNEHEISNVGLVKSKHKNPVQQWIIRSNPASKATTTQGITPEAPPVSAAPPRKGHHLTNKNVKKTAM